MDAFIGTIMPVAFNYPPAGWMFCNGQTVPIGQFTALFGTLGFRYGGDNQTVFGIPDLRGRTMFGSQGSGTGLTVIAQGAKGGANDVPVLGSGTAQAALSVAQMPQHTHTATLSLSSLTATTNISVGTATTGGNTVMAAGSTLTSTPAPPGASAISAAIYLPAATPQTAPFNLGGVNTIVSSGSGSGVTNLAAGTGAPFSAPFTTTATASVMPPFIGMNFVIAAEGVFPSRN